MGADGHIAIYDWQKVKDKYDEESIDSLMAHLLGSGTTYIQKLEGREYLTRYWGDNIICNDALNAILYSYDKNSGSFDGRSYAYESHIADYFMKLDKEYREILFDMLTFIEKECRLTQWEVWT